MDFQSVRSRARTYNNVEKTREKKMTTKKKMFFGVNVFIIAKFNRNQHIHKMFKSLNGLSLKRDGYDDVLNICMELMALSDHLKIV